MVTTLHQTMKVMLSKYIQSAQLIICNLMSFTFLLHVSKCARTSSGSYAKRNTSTANSVNDVHV